MSEIKEYYSNEDNCYADVRESYKLSGDKNTTFEQLESVQKALALAYLYAPTERSRIAVDAALVNLEMRMPYFLFSPRPSKAKGEKI